MKFNLYWGLNYAKDQQPAIVEDESVCSLQSLFDEIWKLTLLRTSSLSENSPSLPFSIFKDSAPLNPIGKSSWLTVETRWTCTTPSFMCMKLVALVSSRSNNVISKLWPRLRQCNGCLSLCPADSIYFLGPTIIIWFTPLYKMIFAWNGFFFDAVWVRWFILWLVLCMVLAGYQLIF